MVGEIQATPKGAAFWVHCPVDHLAHPGLHQGTSAHGAGFKGHQQAAAVEAPVAPEGSRLPERHQFGMAQGILLAMAHVAAPADGHPLFIENHGRHRHLPLHSHPMGKAQQAPHPEVVVTAPIHVLKALLGDVEPLFAPLADARHNGRTKEFRRWPLRPLPSGRLTR